MDSRNSIGVGTLGSAPDETILEVIFGYVATTLSNFEGSSDANENALTNRLCKDLEFSKPPEYSFYFHHQNLEDDTRSTSTDFAVFATAEYFSKVNTNQIERAALVKFEAKRLSKKLPKRREKEYVIGEYENGKQTRNSGGIERFKNERHGKDTVNACILGYLQTDSRDYWLTKINGWIQDEIDSSQDKRLMWEKEDCLKFSKSKKRLSFYESKSSRLSKEKIRLKHIWIDFT